MALTKKSLELPLINGLDTKTDDKQIKVGKLLSAQNCEFHKPGKIMKRSGFNNISNAVADNPGNNITDGQAVMTYKDELLAFDKNNIYSYVSSIDKWKDKGDFQSIYLTSDPITNGTSREYMSDSAAINGLECYVFIRDNGTTKSFYYSIVDSATKQLVVGPELVSTTALSPKVVACGDVFVLYYYSTFTGQLYKGVLPLANITGTVAFAPITDAAGSANINTINELRPIYDVLCWNSPDGSEVNQIYIAFNSGPNSGDATISLYDGPFNNNYATQIQFTGNLIFCCRLIDNKETWTAGNTRIGLVWNDLSASENVNIRTWSADLTTADMNEVIPLDLGAGTYVSRIVSACSYPSTTGNKWFIGADYLFDSAQIYSTGILIDDVANTPDYIWNIGQTSIAADPFIYNGKAYQPVVAGANMINLGDPSSSTYFLINENGDAVARWNRGTAGGINYTGVDTGAGVVAIPWVPSTELISDTQFITSMRNVTTFAEVSGQTQTGIFRPQFDFFEPERSYSRDQIASSLYVGGGMLFQYDGQNLVEEGYNWDPYLLSVSTTAPGATYEYQYVAVWEWVDNIGNVHRSSPSDAFTLTTASPIGAGAQGTDISVYPLTLTYKTEANNRTPVMCVIYRTKDKGSIFYRLPVTEANKNDETAVFITPANDNTLDADLTVELYTGGEVGNDAPPPVGAMTVYRDRLFVLDSSNPLVIYYSKKVNFATAVDFSDSNLITVDPTGGPITGLASMDDKLIIFKQNSIRYISGQGPNPDGTNDDYGSTTLITTDAGCINSRSIVETPEGLMFKSSKGIYFLNRGLQVSYIGAPVERWNEYFITSAVLMADNNQVRFTLENDAILVYDYFVETWVIFTPLAAVDSILWNGSHTLITSSGRVQIQNVGIWTDNGTGYSMEVMTGWLTFGGIQGFQRLYKLTLLGSYNSNHVLDCTLYYDYNNASFQTINVIPQVPSTYGEGDYGDEPYGGDFDLYQYELRNQRQKCMSVKIKIRDSAVAGETLDRGYELSNIRFSYGVIGGANRLRNAQTFGN